MTHFSYSLEPQDEITVHHKKCCFEAMTINCKITLYDVTYEIITLLYQTFM